MSRREQLETVTNSRADKPLAAGKFNNDPKSVI